MSPIIGLDLDSVLSYTEETLQKYIQDNFGFLLDWDKVDRYELEYFPGLSKEAGIQLKEEIENGVVLMDVRPHEYARYSTMLLRLAGFDTYIVTARPKNLEKPTKKWLDMHGIIYDKMFLTRSLNKYELVKEFDIKAFVEDRSDVLESIESECGVLPLGLYLVDHPWNRKCNNNSIERVDNIMRATNEIIRRVGNDG